MPISASPFEVRIRAPGAGLVLVGIDDTDNLESRGTGHLVREIAERLTASGIATALDVTRHQLLFDRRIPYTSHNSSLCLVVEIVYDRLADLADVCRRFLLEGSAPGSDAGLCIARLASVAAEVEDFGRRAKKEILARAEAEQLATRHGLLLEGLTGDFGGMIGALAAVGLRKAGTDGRVTWRPGLRTIPGIATVADLVAHAGIDEVRCLEGDVLGARVDPQDRVDVRPWPRAVLIDNRAVLIVERAGSYHDRFDWQLVPKDVFRRF